ncbi:tetratricopeptide repeat protein [candidate division WOR-3 bacterium]|nr:tetratricopeptide repeat protein [candidate division WOR-3 bacterium]
MSNAVLIIILLLPADPDAARYHEFEMAVRPSYDNYFRSGLHRFIRGDVEESIGLFEKIKSADHDAYYYLGIAHYRQGDHEWAADCFRTVSRRRPAIWQPYYFLSLIALERHDIDGARRFLGKITDLDSRARIAGYISDYEMLEQAQRSYAAGRYEEALQLYGRITAFHGYRDIGMALTYVKMGRHREGLVLLDSIVEHSSDQTLMLRAGYEAARQYALLQEIDRAKQYLHEYLRVMPDDNAKFLMGRILNDEAKYDSAAIYLADLPDSVDSFLFFKGRVGYFLGSWGSAEEKLMLHREIHRNSPYADRALYILASINHKRKEYGHAIRFWQELVDSFPASRYVAASLASIGDSYFNLQEYSMALFAYNRVAGHNPSEQTSAEVGLKTYETKFHLGHYPSLIDALRNYIRENPGSTLRARVRLRIAQLHYERQEYYRSIDELNGVIEENRGQPVEAEALTQKIQAVQAVKDTFELFKCLRSLLNSRGLAEYRLYAANEIGALWAGEMRYDSALHYYNLLLEAETYRESAMLKIADIYGRLGRTQESLAIIERLISSYPQSVYMVDAHILRSRALKNEGQYDAAKQVLIELTERIGERADVCMEIGHLYYESGQFVEARQSYLRACALYEQHRDNAARSLILAGDASVAIGDEDQGREHYLHASMIAESPLLKSGAIQKLNKLGDR